VFLSSILRFINDIYPLQLLHDSHGAPHTVSAPTKPLYQIQMSDQWSVNSDTRRNKNIVRCNADFRL